MRDYDFYYTQDGSIGLYSYADKDVYHSKFGALTEAWEKFVIPSGINKMLNSKEEVKILDICYGIGYNTKAMMSYVINHNEKYFQEKNKNKFLKKIKKIKKIFFKNKKNKNLYNNIDSLDTNKNQFEKEGILLTSNESSDNDKTFFPNNKKCYNNLDDNIYIPEFITKIKLDCLDINTELIKISPLLKTVITPQEVFTRIIPKIFECFETYWKIKRYLTKISLKFAPKNNKDITELLDLKFNNNYENINKQYRIHKFVNYVLVDTLVEKYKDKYLDQEIKKILKDRKKRHFFEPSVVNYALYKQNKGYKVLSKFNLFAFLHNIYYDHLSNRYKKIHFDDIKSLFNINFYADDARKSILDISEQYDLMFLDAFTFSKAPELWTIEFMAELYRRLSPNGIIMTYSNSALVRNTFIENNFYIGKIKDPNTGKCIGTVAAKDKSMIEHPLSNYEMGLCSTRAGIPYHDYSLADTKEVILKRREQEFKSSDLMTSSQYMRYRSNLKEGQENEE